MGTFASLTLPGEAAEQLESLSARATDCFSSVNNALSIYSTNSELSRLNLSAGVAPAPLSPESLDVLRLSLKYAELSDGCFDPTVAPLVQFWGFSGGTPPERMPSDTAVKAARNSVGYRYLEIHDDSAYLSRPGMKVDLGGIAKGYAVDLCYERLADNNSVSMLINLGGNIRCHGTATRNRQWRIGVRNPFDGAKTIGALELASGMAVATSGSYERFVTIGGERYSHLIDPRTGRPSRGIAGVTALSSSATEADAMSTVLFIMGMEESRKVLSSLPSCQALFVPDRHPMEIWITPGLQALFTPNPEHAARVRVLATEPDPCGKQ